MTVEIKIVNEENTRRSAIKTAAQVAVTAPAVAFLLTASTKSVFAQKAYDQGPGLPVQEEPSTDHVDDVGAFDDTPLP
jgi:hypothetical protein